MKKPELLSPAGDLARLKVAFAYGADAVYIGGKFLSMRAKAKNFTYDEMEEGVRYAHSLGKRVYAAANIAAHNHDFARLGDYLLQLESIGVDALLVSDVGVFSEAKKLVPSMEIHISTQANITNHAAAAFWHGLGAKRVVLARELSLKEIAEIRDKVPGLEMEAFVHGSMCMAYSGRCLISNFLNARDAMPSGGELGIHTDMSESTVVVDISDTGDGIPRENLKRIFDPFFTTKGIGKGTGLGLAVSYGIIQEHGGGIFVESNAGKGTRFTLKLPARLN